MPVVEGRSALGCPVPELVEGCLQLPSQQSKSCLHLRLSGMLPGFQEPVDIGQQPAGDNQPRLLVIQLNFCENLLQHSQAAVMASAAGGG